MWPSGINTKAMRVMTHQNTGSDAWSRICSLPESLGPPLPLPRLSEEASLPLKALEGFRDARPGAARETEDQILTESVWLGVRSVH